jgi:dynein heavy chain
MIRRVTRNLHIVLTLSPAGGKFRQRCRMNPAFVNCCTIDWYDEWEEEAMLSVAEVFFEKWSNRSGTSPEFRIQLMSSKNDS